MFTLIFHQWTPNKRWSAVIADDRCNDERRLVRWALCASAQNEELHETLLRLHFKTLFRWKVQNIESLYADFLFHSLLLFCCITLQFPFNITFALCSRADSYLNELFLNAAKVSLRIQVNSLLSSLCFCISAVCDKFPRLFFTEW